MYVIEENIANIIFEEMIESAIKLNNILFTQSVSN